MEWLKILFWTIIVCALLSGAGKAAKHNGYKGIGESTSGGSSDDEEPEDSDPDLSKPPKGISKAEWADTPDDIKRDLLRQLEE